MHEALTAIGAMTAVALFAVEREKAILSAFAILIGAGIIVSAAAWLLLRREVRRGRAEPATTSPAAAEPDADAEPGQAQPQA